MGGPGLGSGLTLWPEPDPFIKRAFKKNPFNIRAKKIRPK